MSESNASTEWRIGEAQPKAPGMSIQEALQRAHAHWNAGQADQAEQLCQRVLAAWPGQADALHLMGLMAHAYGKLDLAIQYLRQACLAPRAPAVYSSNLAEMLRQKGLLTEGEAAAQRAVDRDPSLVSAWNNLGILLQEAGKTEQSAVCLERVVGLKPDWPEAYNNLANTYRRLNRADKAEVAYRRALALNPAYASAHSNLANLLCAQGQHDAAAASARQAIELDPRLPDAYLNLAEVETSRHQYAAALAALNALGAFAPNHVGGLIARALTFKRLDRADEGLDCARRAVAAAPQSADAHYALAQILQHLDQHTEALTEYDCAASLPGTVAEDALIGSGNLLLEAGRKAEAMQAFDRVLARFPNSVRALVSRADAKQFTVGDPDIDIIEGLLADPARATLTDRMSAHFALGKAYMDCADGARAFHHLNQGNAHKRGQFHYDATATDGWLKRIQTTFSAARLAELSGQGAVSDLPVFVIGMPRSGTTLIEQILASHADVTGAGELPALRFSIDQLGDFPASFAGVNRQDMARIGEYYLSQVTPLAQGRPRVVDKMPANFFYAGLIPAILQGARIVHCRRDPVDTCLSCYTKQFAGEQQFTYDMQELGAFYRGYEDMMSHWRTVLPPTQFIEVDYEAVVDDLETQARRLIDFIGLPWDASCLSFHENTRAVRTASVNQVRQPIYTSSKGRWHRYAEHLTPLLNALQRDVMDEEKL